VKEETGLDAGRYVLTDWGKQNEYEIFKRWRSRYAPGVTHNMEHVFSLLVPEPLAIVMEPREHLAYEWLPWAGAAEKVFSWSNADAIRELPRRGG
jgi:dATP pyrophosphohydrolase